MAEVLGNILSALSRVDYRIVGAVVILGVLVIWITKRILKKYGTPPKETGFELAR